jgi:Flp pilus assembly protein TadG
MKTMTAKNVLSTLNNQQGISAVIVAVCLVMLIGFIALAIDISHLVVARNELQNAADAGALAGAAELYTDDGKSVNTKANQIGFDSAVANFSEQSPVEVNLGSLSRGFTPNDSTAPVALWGVSTEELDENPNFINAVRARTRRQNIPITSFFARIFGYDSFEGFAEAVAYIGFAGTLKPSTLHGPIAICEQAIKQPDGSYDCNEGRFYNDAAGGQDEETAYWTSLDQGYEGLEQVDDVCSGGTNASEVKPMVECGAESPHPMLRLNENMAVNNGQIDAVFNTFYNCWEPHKDDFVSLTLPVIDCANDPTTCAPLVGAVEVTIVHITQQPNYKDLPLKKKAYEDVDGNEIIAAWEPPPSCSSEADPDKCVWYDFAAHYNLIGADVNPDAPPG